MVRLTLMLAPRRRSPLGMETGDCPGEIVDHSRERKFERGAAADQHIVIPGAKSPRVRKPHDRPQPPPDSVTLDRVAYLLRHRESDPRWSVIGTLPRLQNKGRNRSARTGCGGDEVRSFSQPLHGWTPTGFVIRQALSRLRPRARRAFSTFRPPFVSMRARNP